MTDLDSATQRYLSDARFKVLVDTISDWYLKQNATPSEVHSAAHLACWKIEMSRTRPMFFRPGDDLPSLHMENDDEE